MSPSSGSPPAPAGNSNWVLLLSLPNSPQELSCPLGGSGLHTAWQLPEPAHIPLDRGWKPVHRDHARLGHRPGKGSGRFSIGRTVGRKGAWPLCNPGGVLSEERTVNSGKPLSSCCFLERAKENSTLLGPNVRCHKGEPRHGRPV